MELATFDVIAFTSENGVTSLFREIDAQNLDARAFGRARLAAIGPGTAKALREHGLRADIVPPEFVGERLADAILADEAVSGILGAGESARVAIPRAKVAREVVAERLRAAGCEVEVVPVYETRSAAREGRAKLVGLVAERAIDAILLTSSSTADSLCDMLGDGARELLETAKVLVASIGPITTRTAEARGLEVAVTAGVSTAAGLVAALEEHLAKD